ncbi:MFS transporter [Streptomyces sp. 549]|uniref:MFS transporter n=1 Tax=Streptomyces sp. 549 TaxID=3049076 RepID=UPI0024C39E07|nr:MFS transporter [Streptomyces sp. 549]MDK1472818.1 MFS transporter [Streptomyces sp. 549]
MSYPVRLYTATAFSARLADEGMPVAVVLLALHRTGSPGQGAFVLTAWLAPHVLAAPLTGAAVARVRRPVALYAGALAAFAVSIAVLSLAVGRLPTALSCAIAVAGGSCGPFVSGGLSSLVAGLASPGPARDNAYAWDAAVYNAASAAGPAAVAALAALLSPATAMVVLGGSSACAAALVVGVLHGRAPDAPPSPREAAVSVRTPVLREAVAGLSVIMSVRELRAVTAATSTAFVGLGALSTTAVLLTDSWGRPSLAGLLLTGFALGALAGCVLAARQRKPWTAHRMVTVGLSGTGLALGAAAWSPHPALSAAVFAVAGMCDGPVLSATLRLRADHTPARLRAHVFTVGAGLKISAAACGAALVGVAAGMPPALLLLTIAGLQLAAALLYLLLRAAPDPDPDPGPDPAPGPL